MTRRTTTTKPSSKKTPPKATGSPSSRQTSPAKDTSSPTPPGPHDTSTGDPNQIVPSTALAADSTPTGERAAGSTDEQDPTTLPLFASAPSARRLAGSLAGRATSPEATPRAAQTEHPPTPAPAPTGTAPAPTGGASTSPAGIPTVAPATGATFGIAPRGAAPQKTPQFSSTPAAPLTPPVMATSTVAPTSASDPLDYILHAPAPDQDDEAIDWALVRRVRSEVAETLSDHLDGARLVDPETQGPVVERTVADKLTELERQARITGQSLFGSRESLRRVAQAVFDDLFGRGRLLRLTTLPGLENIEIRGCDDVTLLFADGRIVKAEPVADSDDELIEELQYIASTAPTGEKAFSPAEPRLHMMLPDGSRLSAAAWYTSRPTATIRIHRYVDVTLADMVGLNMLSREAADFLSASIKAGKSVVVSGMPGAGKTTLIRAILNELDPDVAIATIESMFELLMHEMPARHHRVWAAEATEGAGERLPNGRRIGQVTMSDALRDALRQNVDRMVVGEVLGPEVRAMIDAMKVGKGSVSTIHATSAPDTVERLVSALMDPENGLVSVDHAYREVATHIDLIVYVDVIDETEIGGRKNRFVAQIFGIERSGDAHYSPVKLWDRGPDRRAAAQGISPSWIDDLMPYGITDQGMRGAPVDTWQAPLTTLRDYSSTRRTA